MDIDQLKLVLETLQSVGHEAGSLAVLWMWLKFGAAAVGHLSIMIVIVVVAYFVYKAVRMSYGDDRFFRDMRDQLRTGTGGGLTTTERDHTMAALRALVADTMVQKRTP